MAALSCRGSAIINKFGVCWPQHHHPAPQVLPQLVGIVRHRSTFALILPESILVSTTGDICLERGCTGLIPSSSKHRNAGSHQGRSADAQMTSAFVPPELSTDDRWDSLTDSAREAAYSWNLGVSVFTMLAGYPPFAATSADACPFFADFESSHRLACPPHFSSAAIGILVAMLSVPPEQRAGFRVRGRPFALRPSFLLAPHIATLLISAVPCHLRCRV